MLNWITLTWRVFCSANWKDDRKTAEECYNYIKKKQGSLSTQEYAPQLAAGMLMLRYMCFQL
jgi:hypothetical protein